MASPSPVQTEPEAAPVSRPRRIRELSVMMPAITGKEVETRKA